MKTVRLQHSLWICLILLVSTKAAASGTFALEGDARGVWLEKDDPSAEVEVIGISIRKILSDNAGDRWMLSGLVELQDDLSEVSLHEAYVRYKGPMGRWNVTLGRFQLPFSLLSNFSTSRLLYESINPMTAGLHADGGTMLSGVIGDMDYGVALTQGIGVHDDPEVKRLNLLSGRLGWTFGDTGDFSAGVSILIGETAGMSHGSHNDSDTGNHNDSSEMSSAAMLDETRVKRRIVGMDGTAYLGLWLTRWEIQTGTIDNETFIGGFAMADYSVLPRLDVTGAIRLMHYQYETTGSLFAGLAYRSPWCMIRGGYTYDNSEEDGRHGISVQLYRLVSWPF